MEDKTLIMTENSEILMKNANKLKRKTQWEYYKGVCIMVGIALLCLFILGFVIWGLIKWNFNIF